MSIAALPIAAGRTAARAARHRLPAEHVIVAPCVWGLVDAVAKTPGFPRAILAFGASRDSNPLSRSWLGPLVRPGPTAVAPIHRMASRGEPVRSDHRRPARRNSAAVGAADADP